MKKFLLTFLEPHLIFHRFPGLRFLEQETANHVVNVQEGCISGTRLGFATLRDIDAEAARNNFTDFKEKIIDSLKKDVHFNKETGGFCNNYRTRPTVYATTLALSLINEFFKKKHHDPLTKRNAEEVLKSWRVTKIIDFIKKSQCPNTGGFFEGPDGLGDFPTILRTKNACTALYHLQEEIPNKNKVVQFIKYHFIELKKGVYGCRNYPNGEIVSCAAYNTANLLKNFLNEKEWLFNEKEKIIQFIKSCWWDNGKVGGFAHQPGCKPNVVNTYLCIMLIYEIFQEKAQNIINPELIIEFFKGCKSNGGFGYKKGYPPMSIATRSVVAATKLIRPYNKIGEIFNIEEIEKFVTVDCYDKNSGLIAGYPIWIRDNICGKLAKLWFSPSAKNGFWESRFTPRFYFFLFPVIIFISLILLLFNVDKMFLFAGPLPLGIVAALEICWWFIKR